MVSFSNISTTIANYSTHVFAHLHSLNYKFHLDKETGKITSAISRAQLAIAMIISNILFRIVPVFLEMLCAFLIIWNLYGLSYGLYLMIILALYLLFNGLTQKKSRTLQRNCNQAELNASSAIADSLFNTETVQYYNNQAAEYQKIDQFLQESAKANIALFSGLGLFLILQTLFIAGGLAFLSYQVGYHVLIGQLKVGDFVLINGYLLQLFEPLSEASVRWRDTKNDLS
jgi:ATP-binding cassette subfamily B protein